mmetsp:Transcript_10320/g.15874  ORF Transcript_10320/g.15874 Transcript_10320/m.15874 type:complete len:168 (+) Transcript_10320:78-581(+)
MIPFLSVSRVCRQATLLFMLLVATTTPTASAILEDSTKSKSIDVRTIQLGVGPRVKKDQIYNVLMTLYVEQMDGTLKKSGFSTRKADGAKEDTYFELEYGVDLIEGLNMGVLQMRQGERAMIHIPAYLAYGAQELGSPEKGSGLHVPPFSNVVFDIEIRGILDGPEF